MRDKSRYLFITFFVGVGLTLGLLRLVGQAQFIHAAPEILYVAPDGNDNHNCASAANRCQTVQRAVDMAQPDDEIRVAAGVYTGVSARAGITQMVYISKTVTLRGGYTTANWTVSDPAANPTTLDAQGQGRVLVIRGDGLTIEGFIVTGGGGYYSGGGINVENASAIIRSNQIRGNSANGDGGAIWVNGGSAQILDNQIISNTALWGGGLRIINNADVAIIGNQIMSNAVQIAGGGIHMECCGRVTPLIAQNFIANNNGSSRGGGVLVAGTRARLVNNIFVDNQANNGAGLMFEGTISYPASATLLHNTLVGSLAGAEAIWSSSYVTATLMNNIIVSHTVGITNTSPASSTVTADHTLFNGNGTNYGGGVSSVNEVLGDPAFIAPAAGDYHIGADSAALDAGLEVGVNDDFDGNFRPCGAGYDIGADELWHSACGRIYLPLVVR